MSYTKFGYRSDTDDILSRLPVASNDNNTPITKRSLLDFRGVMPGTIYVSYFHIHQYAVVLRVSAKSFTPAVSGSEILIGVDTTANFGVPAGKLLSNLKYYASGSLTNGNVVIDVADSSVFISYFATPDFSTLNSYSLGEFTIIVPLSGI